MANFIRFYREKVGLTQPQLAELIGASLPTLSRWENGHSEPRASDIQKLCEVLGCSERELLNGPELNEVKFSIIWEVDKDMELNIRANEFKIGFGAEQDIGFFSIPKDADIEEMGRRFVNQLRAARAGRAARDEELGRLEGKA